MPLPATAMVRNRDEMIRYELQYMIPRNLNAAGNEARIDFSQVKLAIANYLRVKPLNCPSSFLTESYIGNLFKDSWNVVLVNNGGKMYFRFLAKENEN